MARRKRQEEHENHERWLVSYADFITLLFAFFVVMYSISSVNEGKYRVLSDTLTDAFVTSAQSLDPIQIGEQARTTEPTVGEYAAPNPDNGGDPALDPEAAAADQSQPAPPSLSEITEDIRGALSPLIEQDLVQVTQTEDGIEVEMKSKMLFKSGSASLARDALKVIRSVARILRPLPNSIRVEGNTDNVPIKTVSFPSNWELSAARAASVVHLFAKLGVNPNRMSAIGFGEFRPIADNATEEGRQKNRRVSLVIMAGRHSRKLGEIGKSSKN
jgi:chemotaxis protein MotB